MDRRAQMPQCSIEFQDAVLDQLTIRDLMTIRDLVTIRDLIAVGDLIQQINPQCQVSEFIRT